MIISITVVGTEELRRKLEFGWNAESNNIKEKT
jgi:hypothetical protein